jgi:hypothetical protein
MDFSFHLTVHSRPEQELVHQQQALNGKSYTTICLSPRELTRPIPFDFESAMERLQQLPNMDCEPDGYFVWAMHGPAGKRWQIDGHLFDRNDQLIYVELNGNCKMEDLERLLLCVGGHKTEFVYWLVREGLLVDHQELVRLSLLP